MGSDPNNCGSCGYVCGSANTSQTSCVTGQCELTCAPGFADCDQQAYDGCETNIATNWLDCGGCGTICSAEGTSASACVGGVCQLTCAPGGANCGGCGISCNDAVCVSSTCGQAQTLLGNVDAYTLQVDAQLLYYSSTNA